jgi:hypothetical protein
VLFIDKSDAFFYIVRLPPVVAGVCVGVSDPVGHGLAKRLEGGEPGTILNRRVVANVLRTGDEKSILRQKYRIHCLISIEDFYLTKVLLLSRKTLALVVPPNKTSHACSGP